MYICIAPNTQKSSEVLAAKQMSFEFFRKCVNGKRRGPQFHQESVPCCWPRHHEVTPADVGPCTWHECPTVCRLQLPPADDGRDGSADISQVGRCQTMQALVNHHGKLESKMCADYYLTPGCETLTGTLPVDVICLDFPKAFDKVPHKRYER